MSTAEEQSITTSGSRSSKLTQLVLFVTVFVTGAAVMVIEIVGTRIIGPVFGVGLFVWSALLTATLGALAVGYYAGGILADRATGGRSLGFVASGAGLLLALVPLLSRSVLRDTETLGPRWGPLASAVLLFVPSLITLGMTGPVAVRQAASMRDSTGRNVGSIYAISTAGSLVGTLILVFAVIPAFESSTIVAGTAGILILTGALSLSRSHWPFALAGFFLPGFALSVSEPQLPVGLNVLDRSQSFYGLVEVIDDHNRNVRLLRMDHSILGARFLADGSAAFAFLHVLEAVRFLRPAAQRALQIGLGIGSLPNVLGSQGVPVDVVEIDPAVVRFARQYFAFSPTGDIAIEDGRSYLRHAERRYDVIIHDTFTGGTTPEHLLSLEVLQLIHGLLRPGGVLALNFIGYDEGTRAEASFAVARTMRAVFEHVRIFRDAPALDDPENPANLLFFASDGSLDFDIPAHAQFENENCSRIQHSFQAWETLKQTPDGILITDARNPLSRLQIPIAERHFFAMNALLPVDLWLN